MKTRNSKPLILGVFTLLLGLAHDSAQASGTFYARAAQQIESSVPKHLKKGQFKYGQYVYVKLKHGEETIAKIDGRKSANKYFVDEICGTRYGAVHKKYIRAMTKSEIAKLREVGADKMKHLNK